MTRPHYINGRILLREPGGVHRSASEIAARMPAATVLSPRSARSAWSGRLWEQTTLARQSSDGVLLNMAHSGPAKHPRQVNVIQDLIALSHPESVHPAYAALMRRQLPQQVAHASALVTISRTVADEIVRRFSLSADRIEIIPPGISDVFVPAPGNESATRLGLDPGRPIVAALLDPTPRKNSRRVALTLRILRHRRPEVQVVVAGRRRQPAFGRAGRSDAEIPRDSFVDLGAASDEQLALMYQAADVFLSLTEAEGFGLPAVEALRCGAAVVTTPVPSIAEWSPASALIIQDSTEAIDAVEDLLDDAPRRENMVAAAAAPLDGLRWAQTAENLGALLTSVGEL